MFLEMSSYWWHTRKHQRVNNIIVIHHLGTMNACQSPAHQCLLRSLQLRSEQNMQINTLKRFRSCFIQQHSPPCVLMQQTVSHAGASLKSDRAVVIQLWARGSVVNNAGNGVVNERGVTGSCSAASSFSVLCVLIRARPQDLGLVLIIWI